MHDQLEVVHAWHDTVNWGDADELGALSRDDIELGSPRGSTIGDASLRDWLVRAGARLEPRRWFAASNVLVVEQIATWRTPEGEVIEPNIIDSSFRVENGLVSEIVRFRSLEDALVARGRTVKDQVPNTEG